MHRTNARWIQPAGSCESKRALCRSVDELSRSSKFSAARFWRRALRSMAPTFHQAIPHSGDVQTLMPSTISTARHTKRRNVKRKDFIMVSKLKNAAIMAVLVSGAAWLATPARADNFPPPEGMVHTMISPATDGCPEMSWHVRVGPKQQPGGSGRPGRHERYLAGDWFVQERPIISTAWSGTRRRTEDRRH